MTKQDLTDIRNFLLAMAVIVAMVHCMGNHEVDYRNPYLLGITGQEGIG